MKVPGEMRGRGFIEPANRESAAGLGASGLLQSDVAYSLSPPICHSLFSRKQLVPRATQGALNAEQRRQEDVQLARLDLLYGANVQVHQFGETLLCQPACDTFAAHVSTEPFQLRFDLLSRRHAPLRRENLVDVNGAIGRNRGSRWEWSFGVIP